MIRRLALILAVLGMVLPAWAQPEGVRLLRPGENLEGHFVQVRHLKGFSAPLRSEGRFVVASGRGLIWQGEKPVESKIAITPAGILQVVGDKETMRVPASRAPFIARLFDMLGGTLAGDFAALDREFAVTRSGDARAWRLELVPRDAADPAAAAIASIAVTGSRFVDTVEIRRPSGDWEELAFSGQTVSSAPLSSADSLLFEAASR
jgi:hypothetical protein